MTYSCELYEQNFVLRCSVYRNALTICFKAAMCSSVYYCSCYCSRLLERAAYSVASKYTI